MTHQWQSTDLKHWKLFLLLLLPLAAAPIFLPKMLVVLTVAVVAGCLLAIYIVACALYGRVDLFILIWVLIFPLGYYFLAFPRQRPILTLDRALIGLLLIALAFGRGRTKVHLPTPMRIAIFSWAVFLLATVISVRAEASPLGSTKEIVDVFVLPGALAWYVLHHFPVRRYLLVLHSLTCAMAIYVAGVGLAEMITRQDLLPSSTPIFFEEETGFLRINGPFATNSSFGLIGLISFCFLIFLGRAVGERMAPSQRFLHALGLASTLAYTVMPMFRSILITLLIFVLVEFFLNKRTAVRATIVAMVLLGVVGFVAFKKLAPAVFESRMSDPSDVYARVAQQRQTLELFLAHPIGGVGWGNYIDAAYNRPTIVYNGVDSVGAAHNTLGAILAETGLSGFVPFVMAQVFLLSAFWRLRRRRTPESRLAAASFVYVFLAYWITGVSLTSGYYSDLNLWYLFVTAAIYKFALSEPGGAKSVHHQWQQIESSDTMSMYQPVPNETL